MKPWIIESPRRAATAFVRFWRGIHCFERLSSGNSGLGNPEELECVAVLVTRRVSEGWVCS